MPETQADLGEQVLTLEEAAAFLRIAQDDLLHLANSDAIPAQRISGEWRFLKRALSDWLRHGRSYREFRKYPPHWMFDFQPLEELFAVLERLSSRLAALEEKTPKRGSKQAVLKQFGIFREDDDMEERLADARATGGGYVIVLDTDIVTLHSYGKTEKLQERIAAVEESEELAVTLITRMEILQGRFDSIRKAANSEELRVAVDRFQASEELLDSFVRLDPNDAAREHFERLRKGKKTKNMRRGDMLIACMALAHEALLVTRNVADFKPVSGLRVENWVD